MSLGTVDERTTRISETLSNFVSETNYDDLPKWVVDRTKMYVLDSLGVMLLGSTSKPGKILTDIAYELGGREECAVIGNSARTSCTNAAVVNGTFSDAYDWSDEHHTTGAHIGAVVVPAALAAAERIGADGELLIASVALGYEIDARIGEAFLGGLYKASWHPTTICGVLGACASVGKILGLDEKGMMDAFGIAGTQAFGCGWAEGWNKRMHTGMAARIGVLSALMAHKGYEASVPGRIFERLLNVCSYQKTYDTRQITGGDGRGMLGDEWRGMLTSFKPYPCCRFLHGYIAKTIDMATKHDIRPEDIEKIATKECELLHSLHTTGLSTHERILSPIDPIDAQFSLPWTLACCIVKRRIALVDYFTTEGLRDPRVLDLARRVTGAVDPEHEKAYPWEWPITITIKMRDGREFTETTKEVPGNPLWVQKYADNPRLFLEDIEAKFRKILSDLGPYSSKVDPIIRKVRELEKVTNVAELTEGFRIRSAFKVPLLT